MQITLAPEESTYPSFNCVLPADVLGCALYLKIELTLKQVCKGY